MWSRTHTCRLPAARRRPLMERMADEVAAIQRELRSAYAGLLVLTSAEGTRRLAPAERKRRRGLTLRMQAHQLRLRELRAEFETLRSDGSV